jgi:ABC-type multidrug transport system permease subunit
MLLESEVIYRCTRALGTPVEALYVGTILFVLCSSLGAALIGRRLLLPAVLLATAALATFASVPTSPLAGATLIAAALLTTGALFPAAIEAAGGRLLWVVALDAAGATIGAVLSLFVPVTRGLAAHFSLVLVVFALAGVAALIVRRQRRDAAAVPAGVAAALSGTDAAVLEAQTVARRD